MSKTMLELVNISKAYRDGTEKRQILDDVSLSVDEGKLIAIVGPSGSGKSTLLYIAGLLLSPDSGKVLIAGEDVTSCSRREHTKLRRKKIGFIFQNHDLLPYLKTEDQLAIIQEKSQCDKVKIDDLLRELDIENCRSQFPSKMSGGEKQRAAIARAFVNNPDVILADEPTASLDAECGRRVAEMIRSEVKKRKKAAVMVTHDTRILDLTDKIYRIDNCKLVEYTN